MSFDSWLYSPEYQEAVRRAMMYRDPVVESRIASEIEAEKAYMNQGDGKDQKRQAVVNMLQKIRGSDGYGGLSTREAIQLCMSMEGLFS